MSGRSVTDVERAHGIDSVHEHAERFRKVFEEGPLGMALVAEDFHFLEVNDAFCRMLGYDAEELSRCTFADITHPDDVEVDVGMVTKLFAGEIPVYRADKRYITSRGDVVYGSLTAVGVANADGAITHTVAMVEDVTSRTDLAQSEAQLRNALAERDTLIREIHHRVKNNLQVISSLLSLQLGDNSVPQMQELVRESQARIAAMALVHESLYQADDLTHIDLPGYLTKVIDAVVHSLSKPVRDVHVSVSLESVTLDLDGAVRCGLIVNELVANAYKHAFTGRSQGHITVALSRVDGGGSTLVVADDGVGMSPDVNLETVDSLGLQLVHHLARQLGGRISVAQDGGTRFQITFVSGV